MPALPPVNAVIRAVVNFTVGSVPCVNVFHIKYGGNTPSNSQMSQIASNVHSAWSQNFIADASNTLTLTSVSCADLTSQLGAQGEHVQSIPGAQTGVPLPASSCFVGSWQIANRYRGGKPRTYISGRYQAEMQDPQTFTAGATSTMQIAFAGFNTSINQMSTPAGIGPFSLGCVHYRHGNAPIANPYFDPYTGVLVKPQIRSQRGRLT